MVDEHLRETTISRRVVHRGRFITFRIDTIEDPHGGRHTREVVTHPGAVAVIALVGDDVLMVRQFRTPVGRVLLELPAGALDIGPDGSVEPPDQAAARERLEVVRLPWREAVAMAERGEIEDAKTLVGLLRLGRLAVGGDLG